MPVNSPAPPQRSPFNADLVSSTRTFDGIVHAEFADGSYQPVGLVRNIRDAVTAAQDHRREFQDARKDPAERYVLWLWIETEDGRSYEKASSPIFEQ